MTINENTPLPRCRYWTINSHVQCGRPFNHELGHENGTLTTPRDQWELMPIPVFCIKASDPFACAIIREWFIMAASYRKQDKDCKKDVNGKLIAEMVPKEKLIGALNRLAEFRTYQETYGTKTPD
jgi:hypothetical protein